MSGRKEVEDVQTFVLLPFNDFKAMENRGIMIIETNLLKGTFFGLLPMSNKSLKFVFIVQSSQLF